MNGRADKRGFTVVEAIIVVVVIAVILAVTIPWMRERERERLQALALSAPSQVFSATCEPVRSGDLVAFHITIRNLTGYDLDFVARAYIIRNETGAGVNSKDFGAGAHVYSVPGRGATKFELWKSEWCAAQITGRTDGPFRLHFMRSWDEAHREDSGTISVYWTKKYLSQRIQYLLMTRTNRDWSSPVRPFPRPVGP